MERITVIVEDMPPGLVIVQGDIIFIGSCENTSRKGEAI